MSNGFSVDLAALADAADGINSLLAELDAHQVNDIDCDHDAFGHDKLAGTTKDFCDRWQKGVKNLAEDGQGIAERLTETANAYGQLESDAIDRLEAASAAGGGE